MTLTPEMFENAAKLVSVPLKVHEFFCQWCMASTKINSKGTRHEWQCTCYQDRMPDAPDQ